MDKKSQVDHIAVLVDDLNVAEAFYTQNLDGKVSFRDKFYIRMQLNNTNLALIDKKHYKKAQKPRLFRKDVQKRCNNRGFLEKKV